MMQAYKAINETRELANPLNREQLEELLTLGP